MFEAIYWLMMGEKYPKITRRILETKYSLSIEEMKELRDIENKFANKTDLLSKIEHFLDVWSGTLLLQNEIIDESTYKQITGLR